MSRAAWWSATLAYLACWGAAVSGALGHTPPSTLALGVAAAFIPYALALRALAPSGGAHPAPATSQLAIQRAVLTALTLGAVLVALPPVLSDDLYRYVWDGRVLAAGFDPYAHAPSAAQLASLRDESWRHINHAELPTIYPPVAVLAFASVSPLGVLGPKLLALVGVVLLVVAVARLAPPSRAPQAAFGVALNPLLLCEGPLHGHVDVLAAACLVLALLALPQGHQVPAPRGDRRHLVRHDRRGMRRVWLFAALAAGLKLVGLLLAPVLLASRSAPRARRTAVALVAAGLLLMAPLTMAGYADRDSASGLSHYARRWRGNDGAYGLIERGFERALVDHYGLRWGKLDLDPEPAWVRALERGGFDPREGLVGAKKEPPPRELIEAGVLARPLARVAAAGLWLLVALSLFVFPAPPALALRRLVLAAFLLAPQLHPWYLALLVPLELITGRAAGLGFASAAYVAYAPLDAWSRARVWQVEPLASGAMHLFVAALIVTEVALGVAERRSLRLHER